MVEHTLFGEPELHQINKITKEERKALGQAQKGK